MKIISHMWCLFSMSVFFLSSAIAWSFKLSFEMDWGSLLEKYDGWHIDHPLLLLVYLLLPVCQSILLLAEYFVVGNLDINTEIQLCFSVMYSLTIIFGNEVLVISVRAISFSCRYCYWCGVGCCEFRISISCFR